MALHCVAMGPMTPTCCKPSEWVLPMKQACGIFQELIPYWKMFLSEAFRQSLYFQQSGKLKGLVFPCLEVHPSFFAGVCSSSTVHSMLTGNIITKEFWMHFGSKRSFSRPTVSALHLSFCCHIVSPAKLLQGIKSWKVFHQHTARWHALLIRCSDFQISGRASPPASPEYQKWPITVWALIIAAVASSWKVKWGQKSVYKKARLCKINRANYWKNLQKFLQLMQKSEKLT